MAKTTFAVLALFLSAVSVARATTVYGTIRLVDGSLPTGKAFIEMTGTCIGAGGAVIVPAAKTVTFTAGALSVDLEPSTTCSPARAYRVTYQIKDYNVPVEFWAVPGTGPVSIGAVRTPGIPTNLGSLGIGLLTGGVTKGDVIVYNGNQWVRVAAGANGYVLKRDDSAAAGVSWQAAASGSGVTYGTYSTTFGSTATNWTVAGATHSLGTCALVAQLWVGGLLVEPDTITCNPATFDVTVTFVAAVAGDIILSSDPVVVADNLQAGSLVSTLVSGLLDGGATVTITHNLNAVVFVRCYDETGVPIPFNNATRVSSNALTVDFVGTPSGVCIAGR